jgi:hypothetical protein
VDLREARVTLRERSLLDVLDLALLFVSAHKGVYARTMLAVLVPSFAASWAIAHYGGWAWGWFAAVMFSIAAEAPFTALASRLVFADDVRASDALKLALRASPRVVAARITQLVAACASALFLLVPAMYVSAITLFVGEIALLEGAGVGRAFGRSQRIASAPLADAVLGALTFGALPWVAAFMIDVAGRVVLHELLEVAAPAPLFAEGGSALALFGYWLAIPLVASARFLFYIGFRTRGEGWDIQTRFAAIAARAES